MYFTLYYKSRSLKKRKKKKNLASHMIVRSKWNQRLKSSMVRTMLGLGK